MITDYTTDAQQADHVAELGRCKAALRRIRAEDSAAEVNTLRLQLAVEDIEQDVRDGALGKVEVQRWLSSLNHRIETAVIAARKRREDCTVLLDRIRVLERILNPNRS